MTDALSTLKLESGSIIVLTVETRDLPRHKATEVLQEATKSLAVAQAKKLDIPVLICDDRIVPSVLSFDAGDTLIFKVDVRGLPPTDATNYMHHVAHSMEEGFPNNKVLTIPSNTDLSVARKVMHLDLGNLSDVEIATVLSKVRDEMDRRQFGVIENPLH